MTTSINSFSPSLIHDMKLVASDSPIKSYKLAATLINHRTKRIGNIHYNSDRMYIHGKACSSRHAEASALLNYCSDLTWTKSGWRRVLQGKAKVSKQI
jgi:hypothetical protein